MSARAWRGLAVLGLIAAMMLPTTPSQAAEAAPGGLRTTAVASNSVGLAWDGPESGYYRVRFANNAKMTGSQTWDVAGTYLEWTHLKPAPNQVSARLEEGATYYFQVRRIDAKKSVLSAYTKAMKVTLPTGASPELPPVDLTATPAGSNSVHLSWRSRGPGAIYRVRYSTNPSSKVTTWKYADFSTAGGTLDGLAASSKYYFRIRMIDAKQKATSGYSARLAVSTRTSAPALTVVSYNVLKGNSGPAWSTRRQTVANTILEQNPAIVGLQEATATKVQDSAGKAVPQYTDLITLLGSRYQYVTAQGSSGTKLAYDTNRLVLKNQGVTKLSPLGSAARYAVWAVLEDKQTPKKRIFALSTHLEPGGNVAANNNARTIQATEIMALIKSKNPKNWPVVVMADLNSSRNNTPNAPYDVFTKTLVDPVGNASDTWHATHPGYAEHRIDLAYNSVNAFERVARRTKFPVGTRIDYIFTSEGLRTSIAQTVVKLDDQGRFVGTIGSDHNLIRLTVHLA